MRPYVNLLDTLICPCFIFTAKKERVREVEEVPSKGSVSVYADQRTTLDTGLKRVGHAGTMIEFIVRGTAWGTQVYDSEHAQALSGQEQANKKLPNSIVTGWIAQGLLPGG